MITGCTETSNVSATVGEQTFSGPTCTECTYISNEPGPLAAGRTLSPPPLRPRLLPLEKPPSAFSASQSREFATPFGVPEKSGMCTRLSSREREGGREPLGGYHEYIYTSLRRFSVKIFEGMIILLKQVKQGKHIGEPGVAVPLTSAVPESSAPFKR